MKIKHFNPVYLILCVLVIVAAAVLLPQAAVLADGIAAMKKADPALVVWGALMVMLTYAAAAFAIKSIALRPLSYRKTLMVQLASGFATKLVPAGVGGLALNMRYLLKNKHTFVQAGSVLVLNNGLGAMGHIVVIAAGLLIGLEGIEDATTIAIPGYAWLFLLAAFCLLACTLVFFRKARRSAVKNVRNTWVIIKVYAKSPSMLLKGFLGAFSVTLLFATSLYLSALSLGINLALMEVLLVFTLGVAGAAITPTPGGLGGAEAALTAALMAVGLEAHTALSIALTYRLISYWLPILPGFILFQYCLRRKVI